MRGCEWFACGQYSTFVRAAGPWWEKCRGFWRDVVGRSRDAHGTAARHSIIANDAENTERRSSMITRRRLGTPGLAPVGSVSGYDIVVSAGEFEDPAIVHPWKTPSGVLKTNDLDAVLQARTSFSLDSIVEVIGRLTALQQKEKGEYDRILQRHGMDPRTTFMRFLIRRLVTRVIADRSLPDAETAIATDRWILAAQRVLFDISSSRDRVAKDGDKWQGQSLLMRMLQSQYHDQSSLDEYHRELWLILCASRRALGNGVDMENAYYDNFGLTWSEFAFLCFASFANIAGSGNPVVDPATWNRHGAVAIHDARIQAFLSLCSIT